MKSVANFSKFLEMLGIPKSPTRITFGVSRDSGQFEWSSRSIFTIFHEWRCIFSFERWALLYDMCRFNLLAHEVLYDHDRYNEETVSGYLKQNGYSNSFKNNYLFPLLSSIWIHDPDTAVGLMPIAMVVQYLWNHRLLYNTFSETIQWWTIKGAAKRYVEKILDSCPRDRLHKNCKITSIVTEPKEPKEPKGHVKLCLHGDPESVQYFDQVIVASSAPDALEMLRDAATPEERDVLKNFKVSQPNEVVLHEDERVRLCQIV